MISCYHLTVPLPNRQRPLLDDVSFDVQKGEFAEFIGPAGAGKTVLCSLLSLQRKAASGTSIICGRNLDRVDSRGIAELRKNIGSCAQRPTFLEERSVVENLILPLVAREQQDNALQKVEALIEDTRLESVAGVAVGRLSAAERRLTAILRAVVGHPPLVVVDGGLEGLEGLYEEHARRALRLAYESGGTVVLAGRQRSSLDDLRTTTFRLEDGRVQVVDRSDGDLAPTRGPAADGVA